MGELKAAVIGLGVGEQHAEAFAEHPGSRLVGVCDLDPDRAARVAQRFGVPAHTTDADRLLTDPEIDVVSICTYDDAHAAQTVRALTHGKHVMVEKPVCLSRDEARRIRAALAASGRRLTSNLLRRQPAPFRQRLCGEDGQRLRVGAAPLPPRLPVWHARHGDQ